MIVRIVVWIFGLLIFYSIFVKFRKKEISLGWFLFWLLLCAGIIGIVSQAYIADKIANFVGLGPHRGVELVLFFAILVLLYLMFRFYLKLTEVELQISEIVKNIALMNVKKGPKKKKYYRSLKS